MGTRVNATAGDIVVVTFLVGAIFWMLGTSQSQQPDVIATPTPVSIGEMGAIAEAFLLWVIAGDPIRNALDRRNPSVWRLLRLKTDLPMAIRGAALAMFVAGSLAFAFWAATDVLGGYKGYGYSFATHPLLRIIYYNTIGLVPFIASLEKGTQASFYFGLGALGLAIFMSNRGIGAAVKDTITLFVSPCLIVFEIELWNHAPEDMTWHVTDFLWMGGTADGGYRALDAGGAFLFSNWLVLFLALLLVATRFPWVSLTSKMVWRRH
jgi:hypothetical protein